MKYIITEDQFEKLNREPDVLDISFKLFNEDWDMLQKYLNRKGNPLYRLNGDLDLYVSDIESLGSLTHIEGWLNLNKSNIESLGNLTSVKSDLHLYKSKMKTLGNLTYVGGDLNLNRSNIVSLGNLKSVGGDLYLRGTPLSKKYTEEEIRKMVDVKENIFF
jgi:hypothetical protein